MLISSTSGLSLAFANTRYWRGSAVPTDELANPAALVEWLAKNGALDAKRTLDNGSFVAAIELRETLYRVFAALAAQTAPKPRDINACKRHWQPSRRATGSQPARNHRVQSALAATPPRNRLVQTKDGFGWQLDATDASVSSLLAPVLWSVGDVLTGDTVQRLRLCNNDKCVYLFVDNSRSGARRWCDMKACGNRAKAHRHYIKSKAA